MSRGLSNSDSRALAALQLFLADLDAGHLDVEPGNRGFTITAMRPNGQSPYTSWGSSIPEAAKNMIRSIRK